LYCIVSKKTTKVSQNFQISAHFIPPIQYNTIQRKNEDNDNEAEVKFKKKYNTIQYNTIQCIMIFWTIGGIKWAEIWKFCETLAVVLNTIQYNTIQYNAL